MRWFALLLLVGLCAPLEAQEPIPDTTEAWRYFSLEVGNVWEYEVYLEGIPPCLPGCTQYWRRTVVGDSVSGDFSYRIVLQREFNFGGVEFDSSTELLRLDTLSAEIRTPYGNSERAWGGTICGLDAPFPPEGGSLPCEGTITEVLGIGYGQQIQVGDSTIQKAVKVLGDYFGAFAYAADIGLLSFAGGEGAYLAQHLIYAIVSGNEFGTPFPVAVEPDGPVPTRLSITTYPNPSTDRFSINLSSSKPQQVVVEVFDLLGRRVYSDQSAAPAGEITLELDGVDWPRGIYLVRVSTAEGQTATTRITRQ